MAAVATVTCFAGPRGLYISYPYREEIAALLDNAPTQDVEVIVVTDGERILGLGDLGVGGMGIPVGKLSLYTLCAGIHPATTLPILLDVGTDNQELLDDPLYLGWRHKRVRGEEYDQFIEAFVQAVMNKFPNVLLQWEDFSKHNAPRILERYRDRLCTFNDDIQGTGAVTVAGLLAASKVTKTNLTDHRIVILGAGASAIGICDQIVAAMLSEGCQRIRQRNHFGWSTARVWCMIEDPPSLSKKNMRSRSDERQIGRSMIRHGLLLRTWCAMCSRQF